MTCCQLLKVCYHTGVEDEVVHLCDLKVVPNRETGLTPTDNDDPPTYAPGTSELLGTLSASAVSAVRNAVTAPAISAERVQWPPSSLMSLR